jgi:transglutaminase-like putative cysteine protease
MKHRKSQKTGYNRHTKKIAAITAVISLIALTGSTWAYASSYSGMIEEPVSIKQIDSKTTIQTTMHTISFPEPTVTQIQTDAQAQATAQSVALSATTPTESETPAATPTNIPAAIQETTMYTTQSCYLRAEDVAGSKVLKSLKSGTSVTVTGKADNGYYIVKDGGYLHEKFLSTEKQAEQKPQQSVSSTQKPSNTQTAQKPSDSQPSAPSNSNSSASDGKHDGTIRGIINSAALTPTGTGFANVDAKINSIFNRIFTPGMDTYDKVKACYDYLIKNTSYQRNGGYPTAGYGNLSDQTSKNYIAWAAMSTLDTGKGACNGYSAAFIAMVRMIGLKAGYASGETYSNSKGWMGHHWAEVYIGGETYIFDPQVEDNIANGGKISYTRFCKTYAERAKQYRK